MVETRRGSRTDGASGKVKDSITEKQASTVQNETADNSKTGETSKVKEEDVDGPSAGDKHKPADRSQSPEDRKRARTDIKAEEDEGDAKTRKDDGAKGAKSGNAPTILERGNIYFFFRARVNVDEPTSLEDVARTYIVLKPQNPGGHGGKDGEKSSDCRRGHTRLLALPKKVLPKTGRDRFMAFVLAEDESYANLEKNFLVGSDEGGKDESDDQDGDGDKKERHFPAATAFGEGVYAIIGTGRESHLAYVLTVPDKLGSVQQQLGLSNKQGCFIVSTKNPAYPMPGGRKMVGGGPEYPKKINESFRNLRWAPLQPEHLDYVHSHMLLIGESKGVDRLLNDEHGGRELSAELEDMADDDLNRMRRLGSTEAEAVFASLHAKDQAESHPEALARVFE